MMDGIMDREWGCGWRSLQTLLSQISVHNDIWTLGFDVKSFTQDPELIIDFDKPEISMSDMSQLAPYYVSIANKQGSEKPDFNMLMINTLDSIKMVSHHLNKHFNVDKNQVLSMIGTGGNVALIGGYQNIDSRDMIYLIDPHVNNPNDDFNTCRGIGRGGQGWVDLKETVLYGMEILGKGPTNFLDYSPAIIVIFSDIKLPLET